MKVKELCRLLVSCPAWALAGELTVSPTGLSLEEAQLTIRAAKAAGVTQAWTVRIQPGDYVLARPLVFTPADSGRPGKPVRWIGQGKDPRSVRIMGAKALTGWRARADGVWEAPLPREANGQAAFFELLWVNGVRAPRARHPDSGFFEIAKAQQTAVTNAAGEADHCVATLTGEGAALAPLAACPKNRLKYAQVVVHHKWDTTRRIVAGFDHDTMRLVTQGKAWKPWNTWNGGTFYLENVPAAFDAPGEWLYDGANGRVLYRPKAGEDVPTLDVRYPVCGMRSLVFLEGGPRKQVAGVTETVHERGKDIFVTDLQFENVSFLYSDSPRLRDAMEAANLPEDVTGKLDEPGPSQWEPCQAAGRTEAMVMANYAHRCVFRRCTFAHTGEYGAWLQYGCVSNAFDRCAFVELGAGGIRIGPTENTQPIRYGECVRALTTDRGTGFNVVTNCTITQGGRTHASAAAVWIGLSPFNVVSHCEISDLFYTGVSIGWVWGYKGSMAQGNTVAFCRIHKLGQRALSDMGGVYTLGFSSGTRVANNVIYDVDSYTYGGWGLYTDEGSTGIVMENNLVYDTKDGLFHQHYGKDNVIRNNILCASRQYQVVATRVEDHSPFTFERNIVYSKGSPMLPTGRLRALTQPGIDWRSNLWFSAAGSADFGGRSFAEWEVLAREKGGREADPLFVDPAMDDYRLKPNSPAYEMGFKPFDPAQAGCRD